MIIAAEGGLEVRDLIYRLPQDIEEYLRIYAELLPQYSRYIPSMRKRAENLPNTMGVELWHQWLLKIQNRSVGMIETVYNKKRNTGILLDFAIQPEARKIQHEKHNTLAGLVLDIAKENLKKDAQKNGYASPVCMVTEVEHDAIFEKYKEYGLIELPVDYFEPPFTPDLAQVSAETQNFDKIGYKKMHLGAFPISDDPLDPNDPNLIQVALLTLWEDHYRLPAEKWHPQYQVWNSNA